MDWLHVQLASGVAVPARYAIGLRTSSNLCAVFLAISREIAHSKPLTCFGTAFSFSFFSYSACLNTDSPFEQAKRSGLVVQLDTNELEGSGWNPR